ncbi:uncharacterized protein involved in outer membrane biogenesis [Shimia isoporae]|uniref:Uncharacterized protein involved in outer membrane biogenesis n=1 Tax=Shimia isoporae TaxID=647720 RepID=A0A4R1N1V5_9RHOB|nr:AsmA family protein [Shimia isoporae]TCL00331.1 uncharacterized protein involved in outer membrane biogenesis [Shimia isoporae]
MVKFIARFIMIFLALALLGVLTLWAMLALPMFSEWRKANVQDLLSDQIGQPFIIEGDVRVRLGTVTHLHVSQASIPSQNIPETNLAELELFEFEIDMLYVLRERRLHLDNLVLSGLQGNLITLEDGTTSWIQREQPIREKTETEETEAADPTPPNDDRPSILTFVSDKTVSLNDFGVLVRDDATGFVYDFDLSDADLAQVASPRGAKFTANGSLNEAQFSFEGNYPWGEPFTNLAQFGNIRITFDGETLPADQGGGYTAAFVMDTGQVGEVFDVLGLQRSFEGQGTLTSTVTSQPGLLELAEIDGEFELDKGQKVTLTGNVGNLFTVEDFDVKTRISLFPPDAQPPKATSIEDMKLTEIVARVINDDRNLEFKRLVIKTNAFDQGLDRVGPVSIGRIHKTEEGTIAFSNLAAQAGPRGAPYVKLQGDINDILTFKGVALEGTAHASASLLFPDLSEEDVALFGGLEAAFKVSDPEGRVTLTELDAHSENTDLWGVSAHISDHGTSLLDGLDMKLVFGVSDTAKFLEALKLEPVDIGSLGLDVALAGEAKTMEFAARLFAGDSDIYSNVTLDYTQPINVVRGAILSDLLRLDDIAQALQVLVSLSKLSDSEEENDESATPETAEAEEDDGEVTPRETFMDPEELLLRSDVELTVEVREFVGESGTSSMTSTFEAKEGKLEAGPIELHYGGGYFKVTAEMDAVNDPDKIRIHGGTSGWDFGQILEAAGLNIDAHGTLSAWVDVTGNHESPNFVNSLVGAASLNMGKGAVGTSLLELAGLGIFPWLVSEELAERRTEITCVKAPIHLHGGRVTFDEVVAETERVQLVAKGEVDWVGNAINIRAEPRRVGKPLSRSAWPFDVTGQLTAPKFKLDVGGSRSRRTDGADEMPADREPCTPDILQLE